MFKVSSGGWWLWSSTYGNVYDENAAQIIYQPSDSGFILCGSSRYFGDFNDNILVIKTTKNLTFDQNPTHELSVSSYAENACFLAFPNPAKDKITFEGKQTENIKYIEILDISGRTLGVVPKENMIANSLDLSLFVPQLLFIKVVTKKGTQTLKIVKQ